MKKFFYLLCTVLSIFFISTGCSSFQKPTASSSRATLISGSYSGCGNALGKDNRYRAGQLKLLIKEDGTFSMEDTEQACTILTGIFSVDSDKQISIQAEETETLPEGWKNLKKKDSFSYSMPESDLLILTYGDTSYLFKKQNTKQAPADYYQEDDSNLTAGPILNLSETDVWFAKENHIIYELALYDEYAELYIINNTDGTARTFLTNFIYMAHENDWFTFCTFRKKTTQFPELLQELPEGISTVQIELTFSDHTVTMTYGSKKLIFYNQPFPKGK